MSIVILLDSNFYFRHINFAKMKSHNKLIYALFQLLLITVNNLTISE
jgi:hypothetical protein